MASRSRSSEEYELLQRISNDSVPPSDTDFSYYVAPTKTEYLRLTALSWIRRLSVTFHIRYSNFRPRARRRQTRSRIICSAILTFISCLVALIILSALFRPSYTRLPDHYKALQKLCLGSSKAGRGNVNNERVFIAAALYDPDGELVGGDWGKAVLDLVELLGQNNVYLSIYENDATPAANAALRKFEKTLACNSSIVSEHLPLEDILRVTIPTGEMRMKRIAFLAEVRNRAIQPLQANPAAVYDRVLYINDVMFKPIDAIHLLFSTNIDSYGRAQYGAVCALDFINAFKFYDRFATRDFEGYAMGIPFYPWFTDAGDGISRRDVLDQKDAVRVRACWGGMTAFEAKWFTEPKLENHVSNEPALNMATSLDISPLHFRYENDTFWDASECCLIHADLTYLRHGPNITTDSGIFTNPYVRVAYDSSTLNWLSFTRRFERLYSLPHNILNHLIGMPHPNARRLEKPGQKVVEKVWVWDSTGAGENVKGTYHDVKRIAPPGRFCGGRALLVLNEDPKPGEKNWMKVPLPELPP